MAFNFWVGEWRVTNTDGSLAGTNTIVKLEDNCVLRESWKSANGNKKDNRMILSSDEFVGTDGKKAIHRIT